MTDWNTIRDTDACRVYGRCDTCGIRDDSVVALVLIRDYDPTAPRPVVSEPIVERRCPQLCGNCR